MPPLQDAADQSGLHLIECMFKFRLIVSNSVYHIPSILKESVSVQESIASCKKCRANRPCDNHVIYQLRSLRDTLGVFLGLYIYIRSG